MTHWTISYPSLGVGATLVPMSGCTSAVGTRTDNPNAVTCPRCQVLPSYLAAKEQAPLRLRLLR